MRRDYETVKSDIQNRQHAVLVIHPLTFKEDRFDRTAVLRDALLASKVSLRGWDFPFSFPESLYSGGFEMVVVEDYEGYLSVARFKRSGLYQGRYQLFESKPDDQKRLAGSDSPADPRDKISFYFDWIEQVYRFCECFEFARRLTQHLDFRDGIRIALTFPECANTRIATTDYRRRTGRSETCIEPEIVIVRECAYDEIVGNSHQLTNEALLSFFDHFNWAIRPGSILKLQREFFGFRYGADRIDVDSEPFPNMD